jgi:hypothetical protein
VFALGIQQFGLPLLTLGIVIFAFERWRIRGSGAVMVLKKFEVDRNPEATQVILVRGRPAGLFGWLLNLFHIEYDQTLRVSAKDLAIEKASLNGFSCNYLPIKDVGSVLCEYYRAFPFLLLSMLTLAAGICTFLFALLTDTASPYLRQSVFSSASGIIFGYVLLSSIFFLVYFLSKRIRISVESSGGERCGISFKRSVIENTTIEFDQGLDLAEVLNNLVLQHAEPATDGGANG